MISKKMTVTINQQINAELYSAYLYFAFSSYASHTGLTGTATWFWVQGQEEMTHAWRFYNYLNNVGEHAVLDAIAKPPATFKSMQHMFEETLKHERKVTALINNLVNLAVQEKDHASREMLQWFVKEQVEEEKNVTDILGKLKLAGPGNGALFLIDKELGARVFVMPLDLAGAATA
ncbi:MAG: ferritin [Lentisphaerae bacterium RIFOXYC12_FULL_60_16]|nr:MAG: ferritin [Lentisphaerae bacterium RIFOXYC12_FULL_60_16]OGV77260.1 MAG: ferritin [Lentisphaerae bacterium RIFOXYB12_FULL_60_10]